MIEIRNFFAQKIWCESKRESASTWDDNWTQLETFHFMLPVTNEMQDDFGKVNQLMSNFRWNEPLLQQFMPNEIYSHIVNNLNVIPDSDDWDKA